MSNEREIRVRMNGSTVPARSDQPILMTASPVADIYETKDAFVVALDLPGSSRDQIEVFVESGLLSVRSSVKSRMVATGRMLHREIGWNRYERDFRIGPGVEEKNITATYTDGVLTVTLPKTEGAKARPIQIT